ncbi:hypothetical protein NEDG_02042 [Nematocida displodere]|uniref:Uncharacterized protein n=1 Tax=Nematocida displodere TaxID=1805483 RepID=A0A177ELE2_9MICR|nr:hypothetical protein NEDG_02042 [Nematocida displodere]
MNTHKPLQMFGGSTRPEHISGLAHRLVHNKNTTRTLTRTNPKNQCISGGYQVFLVDSLAKQHTRLPTETPTKRTFSQLLRHIMLGVATICTFEQCLGSVEEKNPNQSGYIVSPHTSSTLVFFSRSNCSLDTTTTLNKSVCIVRKQQKPKHIYLNKYELNDIPEQIVPGIEFERLKIEGSGIVESKAPDTLLLEKVFAAFRMLTVNTLEIVGLRDLPFPETKAFSLGEPAINYNPEPKLLALSNLQCLVIRETATPAILSFFNLLEAINTPIVLKIESGSHIASLRFLDLISLDAVRELWVVNHWGLLQLDCLMLQNGKVTDGLFIKRSLANLKQPPQPQTIAGIIGKKWASLHIPEALFGLLISGNNTTTAKHLQIDIDIGIGIGVDTGIGAGINTKHQPKPKTYPGFHTGKPKSSVEHLVLAPGSSATGSRDPEELKKVLSWVVGSFKDVKTLDIIYIFDPQLYQFVMNTTIDIDGFPDLYRLTMSEEHCQLYSAPGLVYLPASAYTDWANGSLLKSLVQTCPEALAVLTKSTRSLLSPPINPAQDLVCPRCQRVLNTKNTGPSDPEPEQIGVIDAAGHILCQSCLKELLTKRDEAGEAIICPTCHAEVPFSTYMLFVRRDKNSYILDASAYLGKQKPVWLVEG